MPNSRNSPNALVYDPSTQSWKPSTSSTGSQSVVSTPPEKATPESSNGGTQTDSKNKAAKEQAELEYSTLEGDLEFRVCPEVLLVHPADTITIEGIGSYLSGQYFVTRVSRSLSSSDGYSQSCTVIKTGFGDSLKCPKKTSTTPDVRKVPVKVESKELKFSVGDTVKITGPAVYSVGTSSSVKVPEWVKKNTLTIANMSKDGARVLLQPINSWTFTKFLQKV